MRVTRVDVVVLLFGVALGVWHLFRGDLLEAFLALGVFCGTYLGLMYVYATDRRTTSNE